LKIQSVMWFCAAAHYSYLVESPFTQRGGVLLVAGPGSLKSTIVKTVIESTGHSIGYSDLTLKQLAVIRNQIANGTYHTLGFYELEKIYARQFSVAANFEGVIKAMVEEGFAHFAFEDQRCWVPTARCFVIASVLDNLYRLKFPDWTDNGFLRRFICIKYSLSQASKEKIRNATNSNELIEFPPIPIIPSTKMQMDVTKEEAKKLHDILGGIDDGYTPYNLTRKALTVLKWYRRQNGNKRGLTPLEIIEDLKDAISRKGGILDL
jgi:hypothetical protein